MWILAGAAALPLLACLLTRGTERAAWFLAVGFAVSLLMDLALYFTRGPGQGNAWVGYLGYPVQFALFVVAVGKDAPARWIGLLGLLLAAMASSAVVVALEAEGKRVIPQELGLRVIAGIGVAGLILENPYLRRFVGPLLLYVVGCLPFVVAMVAVDRSDPAWLLAFWPYKVVCLAAALWIAVTILRGHITDSLVSGFSHTRQVHRTPAGAS